MAPPSNPTIPSSRGGINTNTNANPSTAADVHPEEQALTGEEMDEGEEGEGVGEIEEDEAMQDELLEGGYASSSQASSSQTSTQTWINWYTSLNGHDYYCEVHEEYIEDDFNLTGLQSQVPFWKEALEMVLDVEPEENSLTIPDVSIIETSAELLFGMVHQRFILTKAGLSMMAEKYESSSFGACPRVYCHSTAVLPCGRSDSPGYETVKLFCPNCGDIYGPPSSKYGGVDGAFFGPSFPTLFFQTYPDFLSMPFKANLPATSSSNTPGSTGSNSLASAGESASLTGAGNVPRGPLARSTSNGLPAFPRPAPVTVNPNPHGGRHLALSQIYVPRIYGFKVSERARSGPRMAWLRDRPDRAEELDQVDWKGRWIGGQGGGGAGDDDDEDDDANGGGGEGQKRSGLFDDDDEEKDDEEEESEEEEAGAGAGAGAGAAGATGVAGGSVQKQASSSRQNEHEHEHEHDNKDDIQSTILVNQLITPKPMDAARFLPHSGRKCERGLQGASANEQEMDEEMETIIIRKRSKCSKRAGDTAGTGTGTESASSSASSNNELATPMQSEVDEVSVEANGGKTMMTTQPNQKTPSIEPSELRFPIARFGMDVSV